MKLILIGVILSAILIFCSFFAGNFYAQRSQEFQTLKSDMHHEHNELAHKLISIEDKLDQMDKKLDIIVKIATEPRIYDIPVK